MSAAPATHLAIAPRLVGEPLELGPGTARAALTLSPEMAADDRGLVHGGFAFGLADYAAMLAVNHPLVVLASSTVRFLAPTRVGERLVAEGDEPDRSRGATAREELGCRPLGLVHRSPGHRGRVVDRHHHRLGGPEVQRHPPPDVTIERIDEFTSLDAAALVEAATRPARVLP